MSPRPHPTRQPSGTSSKKETLKRKDPGLPPEVILRLLASNQRSPTDLANELGLSATHIRNVVHRERRSAKVEAAISLVLQPMGYTPEEIWGPLAPSLKPRFPGQVPTTDPSRIAHQLAGFRLPTFKGPLRPERHRIGLLVDCETTGFDPRRHTLIELALLAFVFEPDKQGTVHFRGVLRQYSGFRDPGTAEVDPMSLRINRIKRADLLGKALDRHAVCQTIHQARVVIAHNATFDRAFVLPHVPELQDLPWLCSVQGIDWKALGHSRRSLASLCEVRGIPGPDHRAMTDALATLALLNTHGPNGSTLLHLLLSQIA